MNLPQGRAVLNEFAAACLDDAQQELRSSGALKGSVSLGYGMHGRQGEPAISQYGLTRQDTAEADKELDDIMRYAHKTCAEAAAVVMEVAADPSTAGLFPDCDGIILVAAASSDGRVTIMRPYRRSPSGITLGDPKITDTCAIPLLDAIFPQG
jgi:hypothetical protein